VKHRLAVIALAGSSLLLTLVMPAATAVQANSFSATIAPSAVEPLAAGNYIVAITNRQQSGSTANNAHVAVPDGFVVDPLSIVATTAAAGTCTAATWTAALSGDGTIDAAAPADDPTHELCPGARLTISFAATAPPTEGTYTWTTTLFDDTTAFELQGPDPVVAVDSTPPPPPTLTSEPPDPSDSADATFAFSDADATATFVCQLDGGQAEACASPKAYSGLGEGAHAFAVTAIDPAGNTSSSTTYSWTVDLTPPPAPAITSAPPSSTASTSASFSFTDDEAGAAFRCRLDSASFGSCTSPVTYDGLGEGVHTFGVKAVDPAGNESSVTSYSWTIDLTNPVVTIDPASEPHDPTNQASANFVFTSNKPGSTFQCRLDGAAFSSCSSPAAYSGLGDGRHRFGVRAIDQLGHQGPETFYEWTVDTTPPHAAITSGPPAVSANPVATFEFSSSEPATFACSLDGAAFSACSSPQVYVGLADGPHSFEVRGTDGVGNTDALPASYSWQIAIPVPPDTTPPGPVQELRRIVGYRRLKVEWALPTDPDLAYVRVTRSRSGKGAASAVVYEGKATKYSDGGFKNGQYYRYEIQAYDTAGNASSPVRVVVPPSMLLRSPRDGSVVKGPPLLLWSGVARVTFYNVQLFRGGHKVLSAWPTRAKLRLHSRWSYKGRSYRLRKGGYRWWVWPAFGPRSKATFGPLLGTGTFVVR
jgi:hypothetical protein